MYTISKATSSDISEIMNIMKEAKTLLPDPSWYVDDDEAFIRRHIDDAGFILTASYDDQIAGFLLIRFPFMEEDNLGFSLHLPSDELQKTAHAESTAVRPIFRGHGIQSRLLLEAKVRLREQNFLHLMATVHPDNQASLVSFQKNGFTIVKTVKKYGGFDRHILHKSL